MSRAAPHEPAVPDALVRSLSLDGGVSVRGIVGTALCERARSLHGLSVTATHALGRTLLGSLLVAAAAQEGEQVQIQLRGDGPLGSVLAISDVSGRVRGRVGRPEASVPGHEGQAGVSRAIGDGMISVLRHHPRWRQPYTGILPLANGEVASDIARYLSESEQTPSAMGLGLRVDAGGHVVAAGGFLVQALPGARDETLAVIERNVHAIESPAAMVASGARAEDFAEILLQGAGGRALRRDVPAYHCPCSQERVLRAMGALGAEEIARTAGAGEHLEVRCEFCSTRYEIGPEALRGLLDGGADPGHSADERGGGRSGD